MKRIIVSYRTHFIGGFIFLLLTIIGLVIKEGQKLTQGEWTTIDKSIIVFALMGFAETTCQLVIIIGKFLKREYVKGLIAIILTGLLIYALGFLFFFYFLFMNMRWAPVDE